MTAARRSTPAVILTAIAYVVIGVGFAQIANRAASPQLRALWRVAAWAASGAAFGAQIAYEHFRLGSRTGWTALHCAIAAGLGGFGLAAFATVRSFVVTPGIAHAKFGIALVVWPLVTGVPAYVAALAAAIALSRLDPSH